LKKNYSFSSVVVKLYEILTCVTLEMAWNKKNRRHYILTNLYAGLCLAL
jgi:hypothetical protein